ncbi:hypothetical protein ACH4MT_19755 [Streptomyces anulatus]
MKPVRQEHVKTLRILRHTGQSTVGTLWAVGVGVVGVGVGVDCEDESAARLPPFCCGTTKATPRPDWNPARVSLIDTET